MNQRASAGAEAGEAVKQRAGDGWTVLGRHWSFNLLTDPKRLGFVLSRYKFAADMACRNRRVLELGCSEGIGAPILAEFAVQYTGIDMDGSAIATARANWPNANCAFIEGDFLSRRYGRFDSVVSLDVIEHIEPQDERLFFETVANNLGNDGLCVIGTPNLTAARYASVGSRQGHVNLYDAERLQLAMSTIFHNVFLFGMNDEVLHTGYAPMAHYLLCLGCYRRHGDGWA